MIDLDDLAKDISEIKICFDPRDILQDPSLIDDVEFTDLLNRWRPVLEECEDIVKELRAAREVVKCANRYLWEADDADASKMKKALKAYRESVE